MHTNAVNLLDTSFCKVAKPEAETDNATKKPSCLKRIANVAVKPIKDDFHKKYGDDVKPNAKIVADFVSDKAITFVVVGLGTLAAFKRMKNATNGLTKGLIEARHSSEKKNVFRIVIETLKKIKADSLEYRSRVAQEGKSVFSDLVHGESSIPNALHEKVKEVCMAKDKFNVDSKLGKAIKTIFGEKRVIKIGRKLADIGIADGHDLIDSSIALGATALASKGLDTASREVTVKDDAELANESRLRSLTKKVVRAIDAGTGIIEKIDMIEGE